MSQHVFTTEEGRKLGPIRAVTDLLARIPIEQEPQPAEPIQMIAACPALRADEGKCWHGAHSLQGFNNWRTCPLVRYHAERQRLSAQLALCGYGVNVDALARPIAPELGRLLDARRDVAGLEDLIAAIAAIIERGPKASGHVALVGTVGTAKTHALLLLFFWARWNGVRAAWLTSSDLRELAQELRAFDEERQAAARGILKSWQAKHLLVFDDLGDSLSDPRAREPGSSAVAALMQDLLNGSEARIFWSSNLGVRRADDEKKNRKAVDELRQHADLGPRVVDRLSADHRGAPCIAVHLEGSSQRHHAARTQRGKREAA